MIVVESRVWRTTATAVRSGDEAFLIDSPVFPDELELLPSLLEQARLPAARPARDARRLGPPARAARVPRQRARRRRDDGRAAARAAGRRPARAARLRRAPLRRSGRRRWRSARSRRCRCPATAASATRELELHPADGHTADGMAVWIAWAARARLRRLPLAGRDPDARGRHRRLPRDARAARAARRGAPRTSSPATAGRSTRRPRRRCWRRTAPTSRRCATRSGRRARCRRAGATASSGGCTPPTSRCGRELRARQPSSGRPMKMSRPCRCAVGLARGREAERLVERDRGRVVLVGVELDAPRAARAGALEGGRDERRADAARRARTPRRRGPRASSRASPVQTEWR